MSEVRPAVCYAVKIHLRRYAQLIANYKKPAIFFNQEDLELRSCFHGLPMYDAVVIEKRVLWLE